MKTFTVAELSAIDARLNRRLHPTQSMRDVMPLIRSSLVRAGYAAVDFTDSGLVDVPEHLLLEHGLRRHGTVWRAEPWLPGWLDHAGHGVDEAAAKRAPRQANWAVRGDSFYQQVSGFDAAKTPGQRAAIRSAAIAGPGDTLICALPTGSGKTDVVLARSLRRRPLQALMVVPTVSLALDLERRVQELTGTSDRFAYHGGLASIEKEQFRTDLASGHQWLTITSPEAACSVLVRPLEQAAQDGRLDLIAVDEAHIVAEWGDDFRPAFHAFAGVRRRLFDLSPAGQAPTTVLLTGTLDSYGFETLRRLFPGVQEQFVTAQATRAEPAWSAARCSTEDEKRRRLLEAVHHLPRPLLIYTSLQASTMSTNTRDVLRWLNDAGYRTAAVVDGKVSSGRRRLAITGLNLAGAASEDLDIVVANSAFGLGVDISDIRAVVHACVPESVDRLYQEVGRSGRDGRASVSLVLWTDLDRDVARHLTEARLIGPALAWRRWSRMRLGTWEGTRLTVDLTAMHDTIRYPSSEANRYWNAHTLGAMDRAGMIRLHWPEPPDVPPDSSDDELREIFDQYRASAAVEVIQSDLGTESVFRSRFSQGQSTARSASSASLASAGDLVSGVHECSNVFLARHYSVADASGNLFASTVQCGGCPAHRAARDGVQLHASPVDALFDGPLTIAPDPTLASLAAQGRLCVWSDGHAEAAEQALVDRLIRRGVMALVSNQAWTPEPTASVGTRVWWSQRIADWLDWGGGPWQVPTLLRVDATLDDRRLSRALEQLARQPLGIVLTPAGRLDPENPKQRLREAWTPSFWIDDILRKI